MQLIIDITPQVAAYLSRLAAERRRDGDAGCTVERMAAEAVVAGVPVALWDREEREERGEDGRTPQRSQIFAMRRMALPRDGK